MTIKGLSMPIESLIISFSSQMFNYREYSSTTCLMYMNVSRKKCKKIVLNSKKCKKKKKDLSGTNGEH